MDSISGMSVFVRVAELRSLSTAARQFGVTPSAISKTLAKFEAHLGVQLVHRTTRQVSLTEDGRTFFERCKRILADVREAELEASSARNTVRGKVRLSIASGLEPWLLAERLPAFLEKHPDLSVELTHAETVGDLISQGVDVALNSEKLNDSPLVQKVVGRAEVGLFASPAYLKAQGAPASLAGLSSHRCLTDTRDEGDWWPATEGQSVSPSRRLMVDTDESLLSLARAGLGIVKLPLLSALSDLEQGTLVRVLPDEKFEPRALFVAYPQTTHASPRVRALIEWVTQLAPAVERPLTPRAEARLPILNGMNSGAARKAQAKNARTRA